MRIIPGGGRSDSVHPLLGKTNLAVSMVRHRSASAEFLLSPELLEIPGELASSTAASCLRDDPRSETQAAPGRQHPSTWLKI